MKILFITANRIGDAILSTGLLRHLCSAYPHARLTVACGPLCVDLFTALPGLERIIPLGKQKWHGHWLRLWRACRGQDWDLIVDLRNTAVSRLLLPRRLVWRGANDGQHKVVQNAAVLGLESAPPAPMVWLRSADQAHVDVLLPPGRPVLALGPAANWPAKQWPPLRFAELIGKLTAADGLLPHARVVVLAAAPERAMIAPVLAAVPDADRVEAIGCHLGLAAALLARADLFIGNDSGLMHLAAAAGAPTLGLFGPGYPEIYGPWGAHTAVAQTPESSAALLARTPFPGAFYPNLMRSLTVATVITACAALLKNRKPSCGKT